jgi:O-antigen biosynthesis alpha-1,3-mannosyltransferase
VIHAALDVSHLNHRRLSGIGIYTIELLRALRSRCDVTPVFRPRRFRHRAQMQAHVGPVSPWVLGGLGSGAQVIHGPDFRVPASRRAARVVTILDLSFLDPSMTTPGFGTRMRARLDALLDHETPDAIIAISDHTRDALITYRPAIAERTHTVWLGGDQLVRRVAQQASDTASPHPRPYLLFVSNIETRKNVLGLLRAFELVAATQPDLDLILIGKPGHESDAILAAIAASPVHARISVRGYCDDDTLARFYQHALAFVYPSWLEGFGIPVVEAMSFGCPVITSRTTATAEIIGETNWGIDPADHVELATAMQAVIGLSAGARHMAQRVSRDRAALFTWDRCAQETLRVYERVIPAAHRR